METIKRIIKGKEVEIQINETTILIIWDKFTTKEGKKLEEYVSINPAKEVRDIAVLTNQDVILDDDSGKKYRQAVTPFELDRLRKLEEAIKQKAEAEVEIEKFKKEMGL